MQTGNITGDGSRQMKILYVYGMSKNQDIVYTLRRMRYDVVEYPRQQENSVLNDQEMDELTEYIEQHHITHLFSIHLIYNLALVSYRLGIQYISVIWDAPYIKLYSPFGRMDTCWFSVFDRIDCERFQRDGIPHVLYQPLAVNYDTVCKWNAGRRGRKRYRHEISFVGSLYDNNFYDKCLGEMPESIQDYFISIFEEAAFRWDGVNRIYGKTNNVILDYMKRILPDFNVNTNLDVDEASYFEILYLVRKIANIERTCVLNTLSDMFPVTFYTNEGTDVSMLPNVQVMPPVQPGDPVLRVYAESKINLNISLKGIEGGTPQRVMDIIGAGGFVLTNYCPETAELFVEDREIVMFKSPEELVEKAVYYLEHEEERERIVEAGYKKLLSCYTYEKKLKQLLDWVAGANL